LLRPYGARAPEWREHAERAARITQHIEMVVDSRASLDAARAELGQRLTTMRRDESDAREAQERLLQEARELVAAGGPFPPELLNLKDQLGAEVFSEGAPSAGGKELRPRS
jgi:chromosome partition protein MukB